MADALAIEPSRDCHDRILRNLAGERSLHKQAGAIRQKISRYRSYPKTARQSASDALYGNSIGSVRLT